MKISLITINRNNTDGLGRTLASIVGQLHDISPGCEIEHIVVDGESSDGSIDTNRRALDTLGSRVLNVPPRGVYNAINHGLDNSSGDVLGLLHSGDVFVSDDILSTVAATFADDPSVHYIYGDVAIGRRHYSGAGFDTSSARTGFAPPHPSLYVRREVNERLGHYDESLRIAADFEYFLRLLTDSGLKGRYMERLMVRMEPGGMSQKLSNRLWHNNTERLVALGRHGLPSSRWHLMRHYGKIIKGFFRGV